MSDIYQSRTANTIAAKAGAMSSPEFLSGMAKVYANPPSELTMREAIAVELNVGTTMTTFENNHMGWPFRESFEVVISDSVDEISDEAINCYTYGWDYPLD